MIEGRIIFKSDSRCCDCIMYNLVGVYSAEDEYFSNEILCIRSVFGESTCQLDRTWNYLKCEFFFDDLLII